MLPDDRQRRILSLLTERGSVQIAQLCQLFAVSEMTVHRDLNQLADEGQLRKVRGGAVLPDPASQNEACCVCHATHPSRIPMVLHLSDGPQRHTCCPHCGLLALSEPDAPVTLALVTDFLYGRTLNCRTASYVVGSTIRLCCTPTVLAFERREEAQCFQQGFGGQVLDLAAAMDYLQREMALEARKT